MAKIKPIVPQRITAPQMIKGVFRAVVIRNTPNGVEVTHLPPKRNNLMWNGALLLASWAIGAETADPCPVPLYRGLLYHAFGRGDAGWDTGGTPQASVIDTTLADEVFRTAIGTPISSIYYVRYGYGSFRFLADPSDPNEGVTYVLDPYRYEGGNLVGRYEPDNWFQGYQFTVVSGTHAGAEIDIDAYDFATGRIDFDGSLSAQLDETDVFVLGDHGLPAYDSGPTNYVEIHTVLEMTQSEVNDMYLREHALFGGVDAPDPNTGMMYNVIRHDRIWKDDQTTIHYYVDLEFRT